MQQFYRETNGGCEYSKCGGGGGDVLTASQTALCGRSLRPHSHTPLFLYLRPCSADTVVVDRSPSCSYGTAGNVASMRDPLHQPLQPVGDPESKTKMPYDAVHLVPREPSLAFVVRST